MKLLKFSGKPKKPSIYLRRVVGDSMAPALLSGRIVLAVSLVRPLRTRNVVLVRHNGIEKIKRIAQVDPLKGVFVLGDNVAASTDSRQFGWLMPEEVVAVVVWPRRI